MFSLLELDKTIIKFIKCFDSRKFTKNINEINDAISNKIQHELYSDNHNQEIYSNNNQIFTYIQIILHTIKILISHTFIVDIKVTYI